MDVEFQNELKNILLNKTDDESELEISYNDFQIITPIKLSSSTICKFSPLSIPYNICIMSVSNEAPYIATLSPHKLFEYIENVFIKTNPDYYLDSEDALKCLKSGQVRKFPLPMIHVPCKEIHGYRILIYNDYSYSGHSHVFYNLPLFEISDEVYPNQYSEKPFCVKDFDELFHQVQPGKNLYAFITRNDDKRTKLQELDRRISDSHHIIPTRFKRKAETFPKLQEGVVTFGDWINKYLLENDHLTKKQLLCLQKQIPIANGYADFS